MTDEGLFLTPEEIYEQITGGAGGRALDRERAMTAREQACELQRAELATSLAEAAGQVWHGADGAAALAARARENAIDLNRAQELLARQLDSFETAYQGVRPVSGPPKGSVAEEFPFDVDHDLAIGKYQDDARHNIKIYEAYDEASHAHETAMPRAYQR